MANFPLCNLNNLTLGIICNNIYVVQACYIRRALLASSWWENILGVGDSLDFVLNEWFKVIEDSERCAQRDLSLLNEQMLGLGWAAKNVLLSTEEQARYSFVDD